MLIIRFDDACETMNHAIWNEALEFLFDLNILPIIGVVPFNEDPKLKVNSLETDFWDTVRQWQSRGAEIAVHGCHHYYHHIDPKLQYLQHHTKSEFVGLRPEEQHALLEKAVNKFRNEKVNTRLFMAPSHSFDRGTLRQLQKLKSINYITDGWSFRPYIDRECSLTFVPQQIWSFKPIVKYGLWTICFHPNEWGCKELEKFKTGVLQYRRYCTSFEVVASSKYRYRGYLDRLVHYLYKNLLNRK